MREIALHILDVAQNSLATDANNIPVDVIDNTKTDRVSIKISDDGTRFSTEYQRSHIDRIPMGDLATIILPFNGEYLETGIKEANLIKETY